MSAPPVGKKYYQVARPHTFAERLVIQARAQIFRDFMARCCPDREDTILDVGVSDVVGESPNTPLPFPDKHFAIATSHAVLEHVGSIDHQRRFVAEIMHVARQVFISISNLLFPVELHTGIPLLHYLDATFGPACRLLGKADWAAPAQLILMSRGRMRQLFADHAPVEIRLTGLLLGPFSSNLFAHWRQPGAKA